MTLNEAAVALGVTAATLRQQIANGALAAEKHGRDWWVTDEAVAAYRERHRGKVGRPTMQRPKGGCVNCGAPVRTRKDGGWLCWRCARKVPVSTEPKVRYGVDALPIKKGSWKSAKYATAEEATQAAKDHGPGRYWMFRYTRHPSDMWWSGEGQGTFEVET